MQFPFTSLFNIIYGVKLYDEYANGIYPTLQRKHSKKLLQEQPI